MKITQELLKRLDACEEQRTLFAQKFPYDLLIEGEPNEQAVEWVVQNNIAFGLLVDVLTPDASAEMSGVDEAALNAYKEATAPAWAAWMARLRLPYDQRVQQEPAAWKVYQQVSRPADEACRGTMAAALWRLLTDPDNIRPEFR